MYLHYVQLLGTDSGHLICLSGGPFGDVGLTWRLVTARLQYGG